MRSEKLYLSDIVEAADAIERFVTGVSREDFLKDEMRQSAVLHKFVVIGEAASRLSQSLRTRYPDIPWKRAIGLRNISAHAYFSVKLDTIWVTATQDIPPLRTQVAAILATLLE
jgi:uncharacterized protein with HEPN domain